MKRLIFVVLALMAVSTAVEAQTVKVKGTVRDAKTGEALPLVNVGLMRQADTVFVRGAASDFDGEFVIRDVKPGSYLLQASSVGYETVLDKLDVLDNLDNLERLDNKLGKRPFLSLYDKAAFLFNSNGSCAADGLFGQRFVYERPQPTPVVLQ